MVQNFPLASRSWRLTESLVANSTRSTVSTDWLKGNSFWNSVSPSRWPDWPGYGEVVSLYLLPEYMGRGLGKALLPAAVERLKERGFRDILLWVLEKNRRARDFYEKAGFFSAGNFMEDEIGGRPLREVLYRRNGL